MQISRRPLTADDEPFIKRLIDELVADELGARPWPDAARVPLLDIQYRARRQGFRDAFPAPRRKSYSAMAKRQAGW
jgi:hypothetical protein